MNGTYKITVFIILSIVINNMLHADSVSDYPRNIIEIKWSNDFIFETDRDFSNGLELNYYSNFMSKSPTKHILLPAGENSNVWHGLTFTQHFFTPMELFSNQVITSDRPFASYFLIGHRKISKNTIKRMNIRSEIQIGLLGKYSGGENIQNGIHEILPTSTPAIGWDNQLQPDLAINYFVKAEKGLVVKKTYHFIGSVDLKVGIPYTYAGAGLKALFGKIDGYFRDLGIGNNKNWQLFFYGGVNGKMVLYNATLQGGLINDNNSHVLNNIFPSVADFETGISYSSGKFSVEFGQHFITPEYKGGRSHKWGHITFRVGF